MPLCTQSQLDFHEFNPNVLGLTDMMANSRNPNELLAAWKGWRDQTGKKMRTKYTEFVNVMNEMIKFSG